LNLAQFLVRAARVHADRPALLHGARTLWRYGELADRVARLAGHLRALGLAPGDRIALLMKNHPSYLEALYAAWWAGFAAVPVNAKLHREEVAYIVDHSEAAAMVVTDDLADSVAPLSSRLRALLVPGTPAYAAALGAEPIAAAPRAPADLAWLFYTSGTTGRPKGVMLTHRNLATMTACYFIDVDDVDPADAIVYAAPMSHGAGLYNLPFVARAARHVVPESGGFDPPELVALSRDVGRLCLFAAPTMVQRLVDHVAASGTPCDGFKTIVYGGGPMYGQDIRRALATMGSRFVQIYGQGESPMTITRCRERSSPTTPARAGRSGSSRSASRKRSWKCASSMPTATIFRPARPARSSSAATRSWPATGATRRRPRRRCATAGCGPATSAALDGDGFLTLKDRSKDLIISGGSNIYPREVEEVLLRHPGVREASSSAAPTRAGARWWSPSSPATASTPRRSTRSASPTSRASSGRASTASSPRCRRTTTAKC
jgi:long-chain acyl-CoA synthetase